MHLALEVVSGARELQAIQGEWADLAGRCPDVTVFQRPEWLIPWWDYSGSGRMCTLAFRESGRLAGLLPMFVHDWNGRRQVTLMGNGISDRLDLTAEPEFATACAARAYAFLEERASDWDVCDWQDLRASSPLLAGAKDRFDWRVSPSIPSASVALPASFDEFFAALPRGLKRNVRRYGEHLRKDHQVRFETATSDPSGELVTALISLHEARWQAKGEPGMLAGRERFLQKVTPVLAGSNLLRIHVLEADGHIAGIVCQFWDGWRASGYITGFDPALDRYSPGVLLLDYAISRAIGDGARYWDFLRGNERYKFQWGATQSSKFRLRLWPRAHTPAADSTLEREPELV
jgi:CelD/BcsL family acetyltransferase involved in cellulose biosynthesis